MGSAHSPVDAVWVLSYHDAGAHHGFFTLEGAMGHSNTVAKEGRDLAVTFDHCVNVIGSYRAHLN